MYNYYGSGREATQTIFRRQNSKASINRNLGKHRIRPRISDIHCACVEDQNSDALALKSRNSNVLTQKPRNLDCCLFKPTARNFRNPGQPNQGIPTLHQGSKRIRNF